MSRGYRLCGAARGSLSVDEVIEHVAFEVGLAPATIIDGNNRRYLSEARYAIAWLAQRHTQATHAVVGSALKRPAAAVRLHAQRAREFRQASAEFRALVGSLDQMLTACRADAA